MKNLMKTNKHVPTTIKMTTIKNKTVQYTSEEQKSHIIVSYDYLASIVLHSNYVTISQCTEMHFV